MDDICPFCGWPVSKEQPYISGGDEIEFICHISCMMTAGAVETLRALKLIQAFKVFAGDKGIELDLFH